jgi:hypothetical protein
MIKVKHISVSFLALFLIEHVDAQSKSINVVTTAVPFLRTSHDATSSGMGSAGIATGPDINAIYWNLAKLPFSKSEGAICANYSPWLKAWSNDMYLASLGGYYKISEIEAIHGLVRYFNPGDLQFTDNNGNLLQSYHPNEWAIDVGYSRKLSDRIALGLAVRYIRSDLARGAQNEESFSPGNAIAADLGFYYNLKKENQDGWSFGAALSNLGSKISYSKNVAQKEFIPANLGLGASFTKSYNDQNKFTIAVDINKLLVPTTPKDSSKLMTFKSKSVVGSWFSSFSDASGGLSEELREVQISLGAEYWYNNQFGIRGGYFYEDKTKGDRKYFSTGASIRYNVITANFSYLVPSGGINKNPLSNTVLFGINIQFK